MASGSHLAFFLCLTSALMISGTVASCPHDWKELGSRCILVCRTPRTFDAAETSCKGFGGHLVSIHSLYEDDVIRDLIRRTFGYDKRTWIGLTDAQKEGQWRWTDGSSTDFYYWRRFQPDNFGNEDCAELNWGPQWNDDGCEAKKPFVCSKNQGYD